MARPLASDQICRYNTAKNIRSQNESDWRMATAYCLPSHYSSWQTDGPANFTNNSNAITRRMNYDGTGVKSLVRYTALLELMHTPHNMVYQLLRADNPDLMKIKRVRAFFDSYTSLVRTQRYNPYSKFIRAQSETYINLGVYGTGPKFVGSRTPNALYQRPALLYKGMSLRDIYILVNDEGEVDTVFRRFFLTYRQFKQKFPNDPVPLCMEAQDKAGVTPKDDDHYEFVHIVHPRSDYDPTSIDNRRHPIVGSYIAVKDQTYVGDEEGYRSIPYVIPTTYTQAGSAYGYSPAVQALSSMGTASAMKKSMIKQGQRAVDPVLLAYDDGVVNGPVDLRPGRVNYGGVDSQGRRLIQALETGNFNVGKDMIADERQDIEQFFFADIYKIIEETQEMTVPQVMDRIAKESSLLAPTMGRLQSEDGEPTVRRETDVLIEMGLLADSPNAPGLQMPPELIEAGGEYNIEWTSALAKGRFADEIAGFMRATQMAAQLAEQTQNPALMDEFNFSAAIPELSYKMSVPDRWMNDPATKTALANNRAQQNQQEQLLKNAAPLANAAKTAQQMQQSGPQPAPEININNSGGAGGAGGQATANPAPQLAM